VLNLNLVPSWISAIACQAQWGRRQQGD